jgi:hypothetical protein
MVTVATFATTLAPTPWGFYDSDPVFQADADKIVFFVLRKLGEDILSVEMSKKMIWTCFEESTLTFNAQIAEYQMKSNLVHLLGQPTGSVDPGDPTGNTGNLSINLVDTYVRPNLEYLRRQAEPYASEIGFGQSTDTYSGSIDLKAGQQDYNLFTDLKDTGGTPLLEYMPSGSRGRMKVVEVFHFHPTQYVYNSNLASNFVASGLPVESFIPDTRFYVLPLFEDVLRSQMLKAAQKIRRSNYSYRISGRMLRIFPSPSNLITPANTKLWIRVAFPSSPAPGLVGTSFSGSVGLGGGQLPAMPDDTLFGVAHPANAPFGLIRYSSLNPWGKHWIYQYTLALCKELLGLVRSKVKTLHAPGVDIQLNGDELITQAREDKQQLLYGEGGLISKLEGLTYQKLAEVEATKAELQMKHLTMVPMPPRWAISIG